MVVLLLDSDLGSQAGAPLAAPSFGMLMQLNNATHGSRWKKAMVYEQPFDKDW